MVGVVEVLLPVPLEDEAGVGLMGIGVLLLVFLGEPSEWSGLVDRAALLFDVLDVGVGVSFTEPLGEFGEGLDVGGGVPLLEFLGVGLEVAESGRGLSLLNPLRDALGGIEPGVGLLPSFEESLGVIGLGVVSGEVQMLRRMDSLWICRV